MGFENESVEVPANQEIQTDKQLKRSKRLKQKKSKMADTLGNYVE